MSVPDRSRTSPLPPWTHLQEASDEELVEHWLSGNSDAFAAIVDRYQRLVFSIAVRIVRDEGEAEDVAQTVFMDIFTQVGKFDPSRGILKVWVMQYAYSRSMNCRHRLEQRQFYSNVELGDVKTSDVATRPAGRNTLSSEESARLMEEALAQLNDRQREVIELIYFEGLKFREAVEKTGESMSQVRHNYYRGLTKIRDFIESERCPGEMRPALIPATAQRLEVAHVKPRTV
jgi:RNA polymerase sigma-70 factor (ECF subfamily)